MRSKKIKTLFFLFSLLIAALIVDGTFLPEDYLAPWNESYSQLLIDRRLKVVSKGLLAPNAYNRQPWRIAFDTKNHENLTLYLDAQRLLPASDPDSRQMTMSQGAFLEGVKISASRFGYKTDIELFPVGEYDATGTINSINQHPVARVNVIVSEVEVDPLYPLVNQGVSNAPVLNTPLSNDELKTLLQINKDKDLAVLIFKSEKDVAEIKQITLDAMAVKLKVGLNDETEIFRFTEWQKNEHRDGLSLTPLTFSLPEQTIIRSLSKLLPGSETKLLDFSLNRFRNFVAPVPSYLFILTKGNSRTNQVKAGMLYARLFYTAQKLGLVLQPVDQVLQTYPEMEKLNQLLNQKYAMFDQTIQMLAVIGKPSKSMTRTPKRDVLRLIMK